MDDKQEQRDTWEWEYLRKALDEERCPKKRVKINRKVYKRIYMRKWRKDHPKEIQQRNREYRQRKKTQRLAQQHDAAS